jgi:hypothetical protein
MSGLEAKRAKHCTSWSPTSAGRSTCPRLLAPEKVRPCSFAVLASRQLCHSGHCIESDKSPRRRVPGIAILLSMGRPAVLESGTWGESGSFTLQHESTNPVSDVQSSSRSAVIECVGGAGFGRPATMKVVAPAPDRPRHSSASNHRRGPAFWVAVSARSVERQGLLQFRYLVGVRSVHKLILSLIATAVVSTSAEAGESGDGARQFCKHD